MVQVWPSDLDVLLSALAKSKKDNEEFLLQSKVLDDETRHATEHLIETQQAIWDRYRDKTRHQSRRPRGGIK